MLGTNDYGHDAWIVDTTAINRDAIKASKAALLLAQAEIKKSGNWMKTDFGWPEVRKSILAALKAIKEAEKL